jgi:alpha-beta hydrolase superfamily lysophospholipase
MTEAISEITSYISANDGTRLFYRQYPVENERGGILIVHGVGEHSGRYQRLTQDLTAKGMSIFSYDQRGHGQSSGKRGHV